MRKIHIAGIGVLVVALTLIFTASKDFASYASFEDATNSTSEVKIVGQLAKDKEIYYNPEEDPNYFSFYATDEDGITRKVVLNMAKPQDFEMSEQIVVTGKMEGENFLASDILLKCPSKYKEEEVYLRAENQS
ncbi:cytochrome c maturation protein CcmE domain-containing protein [Membranihabitans maritimus]|uniref:cytochrome c maturation protein CcmE domain-containing protein n=1 Tax=Membranihabitans maritimus TaxID=2904244 RepID=UPI001F45ACF3|nr:cytochrome c maturation protein CcmE [Membranihabitans maritimus]